MTENGKIIHGGTDSYETDALFSQYCEFHYGNDYFGVPNFPARCARLCIEYLQGRRKERALDLGCAVGRTTFELARDFSRVTGVDFSARFIGAALSLRDTGRIGYSVTVEGELANRVERSLAEMGLEPFRSRVEFHRADAMALPAELGGFDLIFAGNLIDRLPRPRLFLSSIHERLAAGGLLVLTSPYTWLPEFTPRQEWLGGYTLNGRGIESLECLKELLAHRFRLSTEPVDLPFVIRETARKYQHSVSQMTVWEQV